MIFGQLKKLCKDCDIEKSIDDFYTYQNNWKGVWRKYTYNMCKPCYQLKQQAKRKADPNYNEDNRARREGRKKQAVEYKGGKCVDCGGVFPHYVYDFHHLDPAEKEFTPGDLMSRTFENIITELDKCVLLCANCHRERHWKLPA